MYNWIMSDNNVVIKQTEDPIQTLVDNSIQQQKLASERNILNRFLNLAIKEGELLPPWWSEQRDRALATMSLQNDQFIGAQNKVTNRIMAANWLVTPRDPTIKKHINLAKVYNSILFDALEYGQGLYVWLAKWLWAEATQDNGAFAQIISNDKLPWDKPITGMVIGSSVLDSSKCTRTSNPIYPVVYNDDGIKTAIHYTRVMFTSQIPSYQEGMNGVGHCWLSRAINTVQNLVDVSVYKQEKLGSRPNSQILVASGGLDKVDVAKAILLANSSNDSQGLTRYAKKAIVGDANKPDASLSTVDLVDTDIFNEKESLEIGMASLALSGGFPFRDFWPSQGAIARADAEFSHITGTSGYQQIINTLIFLFSGNPNSPHNVTPKFLPKELELTITLIDDDQQQRQAEVKKKRAETWNIQLENGTLDTRTVRELAFKTGDINAQQFEREELNNGRLPNGESSTLLFLSERPIIKQFLNNPFDNILDVKANANQANIIIEFLNEKLLTVNKIIINSNNTPTLKAARQARSALETLKNEYEKIALVDIVVGDTEDTEEVITEENNFKPELNFAEDSNTSNPQTEQKQTTGVDLPPEITEYEEAIQELIEQGTNGEITQSEFEEQLEELVIAFTTAMFLQGLGVEGEDLDDEERTILADQIQVSLDSISNLADDVYSDKFLPEDEGGNGNDSEARSVLWGGILASVFYAGMILTKNDTVLYQWLWTPGKDHCTDCQSRNGVIKTAKEWRKDYNKGIYPKSTSLACKGFNCGCALVIVRDN